jgi:hypothetical protein
MALRCRLLILPAITPPTAARQSKWRDPQGYLGRAEHGGRPLTGLLTSRVYANPQTSERYLDAITRIPPHIEARGPDDPSPGESLPSEPDEGSVAEKEYASYEAAHDNDHDHEKYSTPADALREKDGFFDSASVNKELTSLNLERNSRQEDLR